MVDSLPREVLGSDARALSGHIWPEGARGSTRHTILKTYNRITQSFTGSGVRQQHVDLLPSGFLIVAEHHRIPALAALDDIRRDLTREVDAALVDLFKPRLKSALETDLGVRIRVVLWDYDPATSVAATTCLLAAGDEPVEG